MDFPPVPPAIDWRKIQRVLMLPPLHDVGYNEWHNTSNNVVGNETITDVNGGGVLGEITGSFTFTAY